MPDLAAAMRAVVGGLVEGLDSEQRRRVVFPFDGDMHKRWTYLPGQRPGLRLGDLSDEQLEPALDLLQLVHSVRGWSDTQLVIRIEAVRRELSLQQAGRSGIDPYRDLPYWLVVLGDPASTDPWAWRINGHHLLAQATVVGDQVSGVPHFFGAEPATVLEGPHAGLRALPREEDLARELMLALQEDQRRTARIADEAPADIASRSTRWLRYRSSRAASRTHGWTGDSVSCSCRCSGNTSIRRPPPSPIKPGPTSPTPDSTRCASRGPGRSNAAPATITRSAVQACSSSTTTPRTGPITSTPYGATCAATSPGTCWPSTTPAMRH